MILDRISCRTSCRMREKSDFVTVVVFIHLFAGGDGGSPRPAPPDQPRPHPHKSFTGTRAICNPGSRDPRGKRSRHVECGGWRVGTDRQSPAGTLYCPAVNQPTTARRWPRHTLNSHLGCNHSPAVTHPRMPSYSRIPLMRVPPFDGLPEDRRGLGVPPRCALATQRPAFESSG